MSILIKVLQSFKLSPMPSIFIPNIIRLRSMPSIFLSNIKGMATVEDYSRFQLKKGQPIIKNSSQIIGDEHENNAVDHFRHASNPKTSENTSQSLESNATLIEQLLSFNDPVVVEDAIKKYGANHIPENSMSLIALYGHCALIDVLIKHGADHYHLNCITYNSSLMVASSAGNFIFAKKLLNCLFNLVETHYEQWKDTPSDFKLLQKAHQEKEKFNIVTAITKDWIDGRAFRSGEQRSDNEKRFQQELAVLTKHSLLTDIESDYHKNRLLLNKASVKAHQEELIRRHLAKAPKVFDTDTNNEYKTSVNGSCNKKNALTKVTPSSLVSIPTESCWNKIQGAGPYSK